MPCRLIALVRTVNGRQITTWPISSAGKPYSALTPARFSICRMAIPVTSAGSASGPRLSVASNWRPGNRWRTSPNASGRPSKVATTAEAAASSILKVSGCSQRGSRASRHQRNEKPTGGKRDWFTALNETAAVTMIGANIKTYVRIAAAHSACHGISRDLARGRP
jgi:hypothetical protein